MLFEDLPGGEGVPRREGDAQLLEPELAELRQVNGRQRVKRLQLHLQVKIIAADLPEILKKRHSSIIFLRSPPK